MKNVVIIGGGASGMIAALKASEKHEDVTILESNNKCGKKLLLTGNGKCNYWNDSINIDNYYTDDKPFLQKILNYQNEVYDYLTSLGIYPIVKEGLYYPYSSSSQSIKECLMNAIEKRNIKVMYNFKVDDIIKTTDGFDIISGNQVIKSQKVILAAGSKAYPKTGSDGFSYMLAKKMGHQINEVLPALTSIMTDDQNSKAIEGLRVNATATLMLDGKVIKSQSGEVQFTKNGLSGICIFNLSSTVSKALNEDKKVYVKLDLLPKEENVHNFLSKRADMLSSYSIEKLLETIFNYKLIYYLLKKSGVNKDAKWQDLNEKSQIKLCKNIKELSFLITATNNFDNAQVCTGGVSLHEINFDFSSQKTENLFIVGETLDVDGICGGFNLAFAFISGYIAGKSV